MLTKCVSVIADIVAQNGMASGTEREIIAFGWECRLANIIQFCLIVACGLFLHKLMPVLVFTASFTTLKKRIGGWHADSHWSCFCLTTGMCAAVAICSTRIPVWCMLVMAAMGSGLVMELAPIPHGNNPKTAQEVADGRKSAQLVMLVQLALTLILLLLSNKEYAAGVSAGLFLAAVSLLFTGEGRDNNGQ